MTKLKTGEIEDGVLQGIIMINGVEVEVNIDADNEDAKLGDFKDLIVSLEKFAEYFTDEKQTELKNSMSKIIVDDVFQQAGDTASNDDYLTLQNDLQLSDIYSFDGGFVLTFNAEVNFPDSDIIAQLNDDYSIDEVAVYDMDDED